MQYWQSLKLIATHSLTTITKTNTQRPVIQADDRPVDTTGTHPAQLG